MEVVVKKTGRFRLNTSASFGALLCPFLAILYRIRKRLNGESN